MIQLSQVIFEDLLSENYCWKNGHVDQNLLSYEMSHATSIISLSMNIYYLNMNHNQYSHTECI
jgi:hypothetical protein